MIYLIGVNHNIQHSGIGSAGKEAVSNFRQYVNHLVDELNINLLAEEFNKDALQMSLVSTSVLEKIAIELKTKHVFLDPNHNEREELGIPKEKEIYKSLGINQLTQTKEEFERVVDEKRKYYPVRENFWHSKISDLVMESEMLIIIGADHVSSFSKLLEDEGVSFEVLNERWTNQ